MKKHIEKKRQPIKKQGTLKKGYYLFFLAFHLFRKDTQILLLSALGGVAVFACSFASILFLFSVQGCTPNRIMLGSGACSGEFLGLSESIGGYFLSVFLLALIVNFFEASIMATVAARMDGKRLLLNDALDIAAARAEVIFSWSFLYALVIAIGSALMPYTNIWTGIIISVLFLWWFIATLYILPPIMQGEKNILSAIRKSAVAISKNWRETIIVALLFDVLLFVVSVIVFLFLTIMVFSQHASGLLPLFSPFGVSFMLFLFVAFLCFFIFASAMPSVFRILLFRYSENREKFAAPDYPYEKAMLLLKRKRTIKRTIKRNGKGAS